MTSGELCIVGWLGKLSGAKSAWCTDNVIEKAKPS
jgi:hypothetical protein